MVNTQILFPMVDNQDHQLQSLINGHHQRSPAVRESGGTLWINLKIPKKEEVKEDHNNYHDDQNNFRFEDENEEKCQIQKKMNDGNRIFHVCNKGFSSGKALGGHMRIHVQAANKEFIFGKKRKRLNQPANIALYKRRKLQKHEEEDDDDDETGEVDALRKKKSIFSNEQPPITCSVCDKNFPSMKSLFGHMRYHPNRDRRGIQPPTINNNNMTCSASVDLSKAIGGWSVTAKRGRSGSCKPVIHY